MRINKEQLETLKYYIKFSSCDLDIAIGEYIKVSLSNAKSIEDSFKLGNYTANLVYNKLILHDIIDSGKINYTDVRVKDFLSFIDLMFLDNRNLLKIILDNTKKLIDDLVDSQDPNKYETLIKYYERNNIGRNLIGITSKTDWKSEEKKIDKIFKNYELNKQNKNH